MSTLLKGRFMLIVLRYIVMMSANTPSIKKDALQLIEDIEKQSKDWL